MSPTRLFALRLGIFSRRDDASQVRAARAHSLETLAYPPRLALIEAATPTEVTTSIEAEELPLAERRDVVTSGAPSRH